MKPQLTPTRDKDKTRGMLKCVIAGDIDMVRAWTATNTEGAIERADVDDILLRMDGAGTRLFQLLNLHESGRALNVPLYIAAFKGDEAIFNHLFANTEYCQDTLNAALMGAAGAGAAHIVDKLLDYGADAACHDGACVEAAIAYKQDDIAKTLLAAGKSYTSALAAYIDCGRTADIIDFLAEGAEPLAALKACCRQLSDKSLARDHRRDSEYKDAFDIIVSYATGYGLDMPQLLQETLVYALDLHAPAAVAKIVAHPEFANMPGRAALMDRALAYAAASCFGGYRGLTDNPYEELALKLLGMGADPQVALEHGAPAFSLKVVEAALEKGADPRRNGRAALRHDTDGEIQEAMLAAEKRLDLSEYESFASAGPASVERLRHIDATTGRSGLMTMAAAGKIGEALEIFLREGAPLSKDELLAPDRSGYDTLALLCDRQQEGALLRRDLWYLREQEYAAVFARIPRPQDLMEAHDAVLNGLKSWRDARDLRDRARQNKDRFRLK